MMKRWRVSDIVRAAGESEAACSSIAYEGEKWSRDYGNSMALKTMLGTYNRTIPHACMVEPRAWDRMSFRERCDALVATARRLNVPMNG